MWGALEVFKHTLWYPRSHWGFYYTRPLVSPQCLKGVLLYFRADRWGGTVGHPALWQHRGSPKFAPCLAATSSPCTSAGSCVTQWVQKSFFPSLKLSVQTWHWYKLTLINQNLDLFPIVLLVVYPTFFFKIPLKPPKTICQLNARIFTNITDMNVMHFVNSDTGTVRSACVFSHSLSRGSYLVRPHAANLCLYYLRRLWVLSTDLPMQNEVCVMLNPYDNDSRCIPPSFITTLSLTPLASHVL